MSEAIKPYLATVATGRSLTRSEAEALFDRLLSGEATAAQMGALLMGMRVRGETVDEITGAVAALRRHMVPVAAPAGTVDIVGTGGDGHGTFNVSTLAAIIVAACGVPVAKHGNRAASSRSGSFDVLAALDVAVDGDAGAAEACLAETGLCFLAAQTHHAAMRHVAAVRADLGIRTLFNLLGPLANPAGVKRLLVGVYSADWLEPLARVLGALGAEHAWLVHGGDGLDEITTTSHTTVVEWANGAVRRFEVTPEAVGLPRSRLAELKGGDAARNAGALRDVLSGARNAYRDIACLNAGAALVVAGRAATLAAGVAAADEALADGRARNQLERLVRATQGRRLAAVG